MFLTGGSYTENQDAVDAHRGVVEPLSIIADVAGFVAGVLSPRSRPAGARVSCPAMAEDAAKDEPELDAAEASEAPEVEVAEASQAQVAEDSEPPVAQAATAEPPDAEAPSAEPPLAEAEEVSPPPSRAGPSAPPPAAQEPDRSEEAAATRRFLDQNKSEMTWWRKAYATLYICHLREEPAKGDAFSPAILAAAKDLGFRPVAILREGVFPSIATAEQWVGPDGFVVLEGNRVFRKHFLSTYFEDASAVSTWPAGMVSAQASQSGGKKLMLKATGNLEKDYAAHLAAVNELIERDGKKPLRRGDPWLMKRVAEFYVRHTVGPVIVAMAFVNLVFLAGMVALAVWLATR